MNTGGANPPNDTRGAAAKLPAFLQEIAAATDYTTAMKVAHAKGGQRAFISRRPRDGGKDDWLIRAVGHEAAQRIGHAVCPAKSGLFFEIPMGNRNREFLLAEVLRMSLAGVARMEIASTLGIHYQTVQRYRRELRKLERLPKLDRAAMRATATMSRGAA